MKIIFNFHFSIKMIVRFPKHPTSTPLRKKLNLVVKKYAKKITKKHSLHFKFAISDDLLDVICLSDYYFNITDIIYDIDSKLLKNIIFKGFYIA